MGLVLGAALYTLCIIILMVSRHVYRDGDEPAEFPDPALAMALSSSVFEELFFRGVIMKSSRIWREAGLQLSCRLRSLVSCTF